MAGAKVARTLNRLSDRRAKTAPSGMHADGGGLWLQVSPGPGDMLNRSWVFRFATGEVITSKAGKQRGREREMGLGSLDTVSLAEAREKAADCRKLRERGLDPIEARRTQRANAAAAQAKAMTFRQCAERYIIAHESTWKNAKHRQQWTNTLSTYAYPVAGALAVADVDRGMVMKILEPIWETKPETASRLRGRIESVLDWAKVSGYRDGDNPARWKGHLEYLLSAKPKAERQPSLAYGELPGFLAELRSRDAGSAMALEFLILTVSRTGEVIGMRGEEVDFAKKLWIVPEGRMKGEREHRVPLSSAAIALLKLMKPEKGTYVFPGSKPGRPLSNMAMLNLIDRINMDKEKQTRPRYTDPKQDNRDVVPHGFRATFKTWAEERTAFPSPVIESALAHIKGDKVEAAYMRGDLFEKRQKLMQAWAEYCSKSSVSGQVTPLRGA
jgi:integrase